MYNNDNIIGANVPLHRSNPDLGQFIRKLRVEGGFAISMHKILQVSKNITDIFLTLNIIHSDRVCCGLCCGLPLIDPVQVILYDGDAFDCPHTSRELIDMLQECIIEKWKKLTVVDILHEEYFDFSAALASAPSLSTLIIADAEAELFEEWPENNRCKHSWKLHNFCPLKRQFVYPSQLAADKMLEDAFWEKVLSFVIYSGPADYSYHNFEFDDSDSDDEPASCLAPLLVSKTFATVFKTEDSRMPVETLNSLVDLTINLFNPSFLTALANLGLPSLRSVKFGAKATGCTLFSQKHGAKLKKLAVSVAQINSDLDILNAPTMICAYLRPPKHCFRTFRAKTLSNPPASTCASSALYLRRVQIFQGGKAFKHDQTKLISHACHRVPVQHSKWGRLFDSMDAASFPALQEIEHDDCYWPTADREISKSRWARWAESLLERKIYLVDMEVERWRPRLQSVKKSRKSG
ncbi:hypothetical protein C8R43DRAFT_946005 [Mycena crocata]|nr:hypothetical protein C8R43DRAFT_946005 [Mycena crocata]